jgi:hypothetical protein
MMKLCSGLAGVGAALVFGLAAQAAQASSIQCPTGGDGVQQMEVPGEPCEPVGGYTTVTTSGLDAAGTAYSAELTFEGSDDYLAVGEYIELEMDLDDINAALRANPKTAVELASALGIRDSKSGVSRAANFASAKLTDAEYAEMATYVAARLQNRATGRSDTATNGSTSRTEAALQAFERLMSSIGGAVRRAIMPNVSRTTREIRRNDQGVVIYERSVETTIN